MVLDDANSVAVVAVLLTFPAEAIVASFVSAIPAPAAISLFEILLTVAESTSWCSAAGVTRSPLMNVLPFVTFAIVSFEYECL